MSLNLAIDNLYERISDLAITQGYTIIPQPFSNGLAIVDDETMDIILITVQTAELKVLV